MKRTSLAGGLAGGDGCGRGFADGKFAFFKNISCSDGYGAQVLILDLRHPSRIQWLQLI